MAALALTGCDSSDNTTSTSTSRLNSTFAITAISSGNTANTDGSGKIKQMTLTWESAAEDSAATGITYTACMTDTSEENNCSSLGEVTDELTMTVELDSLLSALSEDYFILADNGTDTLSSSERTMTSETLTEMIGYLKASNAEESDYFGYQVVMSDDGNTIAVGAYQEGSSTTGIDGDQTNNDATRSGAVYVFSYADSTWSQSAYLKASNTDASDNFGKYLAISNDGLTIAAGAHSEDSSATGINGDQTLDDLTTSGAVYVFAFDGTNWAQSAYVKASDTGKSDQFGSAVALDEDGDTLAVGAFLEDSNAITIDGDDTDNQVLSSGAAYIFTKNGSTWSQDAYIKVSNAETNDFFGAALALSADGNILIASARGEDAADNSDETDNSVSGSGAAYIFTNDSGWSQTAYLKASTPDSNDGFGYAVSMSNDGKLVAVSSFSEDSNATNIDGDESNGDASASGAVYLFAYDGTDWNQTAYVKPSNTDASDKFGNFAVELSGDGKTLAVGAAGEDSSATGIDGDTENNDESSSGAVYLYTFEDSAWSNANYIKASNTTDSFGISVALNEDGSQLAVGSYQEDSAATGINGTQAHTEEETDDDDNVTTEASNYVKNTGAVYLY